MNLAEKKQKLTQQLLTLKNGQDRMAFLVESAKQNPPYPAEFKTDTHLVPGCLAKLWLLKEFKEGNCFFRCDSDSQIVKAIAGLLCDLYSQQDPEEILANDPAFLGPLGITQHLTPNRRNALAKVWDEIRLFAESKRS